MEIKVLVTILGCECLIGLVLVGVQVWVFPVRSRERLVDTILLVVGWALLVVECVALGQNHPAASRAWTQTSEVVRLVAIYLIKWSMLRLRYELGNRASDFKKWRWGIMAFEGFMELIGLALAAWALAGHQPLPPAGRGRASMLFVIFPGITDIFSQVGMLVYDQKLIRQPSSRQQSRRSDWDGFSATSIVSNCVIFLTAFATMLIRLFLSAYPYVVSSVYVTQAVLYIAAHVGLGWRQIFRAMGGLCQSSIPATHNPIERNPSDDSSFGGRTLRSLSDKPTSSAASSYPPRWPRPKHIDPNDLQALGDATKPVGAVTTFTAAPWSSENNIGLAL